MWISVNKFAAVGSFLLLNYLRFNNNFHQNCVAYLYLTQCNSWRNHILLRNTFLRVKIIFSEINGKNIYSKRLFVYYWFMNLIFLRICKMFMNLLKGKITPFSNIKRSWKVFLFLRGLSKNLTPAYTFYQIFFKHFTFSIISADIFNNE